MKLEILEAVSRAEIVHYADDRTHITSRHNRVRIERDGNATHIQLPFAGTKDFLGFSRLARRMLRLDKCNVVPVDGDQGNLVIVRQGTVYHYSSADRCLTETLALPGCRNLLHQSICVVDERHVYLGSYGANRERAAVPIHYSDDGGRSWRKLFTFENGAIKHVHGCYWDSHEEKIWVFAGDEDGECKVIVADRNFEEIEWLGDGGQEWRACNAFFQADAVYWIMDSPLRGNHCMRLDRKTRTLSRGQRFPGPVWYIKRLAEDGFLAATACETGPGVDDESAHLFFSRDLETWTEVRSFAHDRLPKGYFKFGVIGFADGQQSVDGFYLFGEALSGLDGKALRCRLSGTGPQTPETLQPKFSNLTPEILRDLHQSLAAEGACSGATGAWAEALLRTCEINSRTFPNCLRQKWPDAGQRRSMALALADFFVLCFQRLEDIRFLNLLLKLRDRGLVSSLKTVEDALETLRREAQESLPLTAGKPLEEPPLPDFGGKACVVVLSPNPYSLYTITVAELLRRSGVQVGAIVVRRLFDGKRLLGEFKRDGRRLVGKIWKKALLKSAAYGDEPFETIVDFRDANAITQRNVKEFAQSHGIPVISCTGFSDPAVIEALEKLTPDLCVFTGGGIVGAPVLERSGRGVLNCHMGILPAYRGMDVVEWPVLLGEPDKVGLTVHVMDRGIDTGDILSVLPVAPQPGESFAGLRRRLEPIMCRRIAAACLGLLSGELKRQSQDSGDGRQYFVMHPNLNEIAQLRLNSRPNKT